MTNPFRSPLVLFALLGLTALAGPKVRPPRPPSSGGPASVEKVKAAIDFAQQVADKGVAEKRPAFFGPKGGVGQAVGAAHKALAELAAAKGEAAPEVVELKTLLAEKEKAFASALSGLEGSILQNQECPKDEYSGSDREALRAQIAAAWKAKYPQDQVLAIRFHMANWQRDAKKTWQEADKSFHSSDKSVLAVSIIVKTDGQIATSYPAYFNRDNLGGGAITLGIDTKGGDYVHRRILLEKVK